MEKKNIMVRLKGADRVYFEEQKNRLGQSNDCETVRQLLKEHKRFSEVTF